jgi:small subunit ribosomal protein S17
MAETPKKAEDLVPDENPLEELAEAEAGIDAPQTEADAAGPATEEPPVDEAGTETPFTDEAAVDAAAVDEPAEVEAAAEVPADAPVAEEPAAREETSAPPASTPSEKARKSRAERKARLRTKRRGAAAGTGERKPIVRLPKPEHDRGQRKERRGVVVSSAMDKTIVVRVDTAKPDPRYKKVVRRSRKFHAHDERNEANVGDVVRIVETRPLSKTKTWRLAEVVEAAR